MFSTKKERTRFIRTPYDGVVWRSNDGVVWRSNDGVGNTTPTLPSMDSLTKTEVNDTLMERLKKQVAIELNW